MAWFRTCRPVARDLDAGVDAGHGTEGISAMMVALLTIGVVTGALLVRHWPAWVAEPILDFSLFKASSVTGPPCWAG